MKKMIFLALAFVTIAACKKNEKTEPLNQKKN